MRRILVRPVEGPAGRVVALDVEQFLLEIRDRREDAAPDHLARDLREPQLHLVQPRTVRRREVEVHVRVSGPPVGDRRRLVRGQVVEDDIVSSLARASGAPVP